MSKRAFLLGLFSVGGQVLLLKELVASLNGDELFIASAMFGWMLGIGLGAFWGGLKRVHIKSLILFAIGVVLLPLSILTARLIPLAVTDIPGQVVPFGTAFLVSLLVVMPVGILSGWLFSSVAREGYKTAASIVEVYLFEGIGAFIGGAAIMGLTGTVYSTFAMALALGVVIIVLFFMPLDSKRALFFSVPLVVILVIIFIAVPPLEYKIDDAKYPGYEIEASFDTPYSRQTVLSRGGLYTLLTDNTVEGNYPNISIAENLLIPPLAYKPDARNILFVGRAEFGVQQLGDSLEGLNITALDPRKELTESLKDILSIKNDIHRIHDDQVAYIRDRTALMRYDIIILAPGAPDNYKSARLMTEKFLASAYIYLKPDGILYYMSDYDTDRYISTEKASVLSSIYNTFDRVYPNVQMWPGEMTLFFGSKEPLTGSFDTLMSNISRLGYEPKFVNEIFLWDRLDSMKISRLNNAIDTTVNTNTIKDPTLVYKQAVFRSMQNELDKRLVTALFKDNMWVVIIPAGILIFWIIGITGEHRYRRYGLFLYFTAGVVSLSLELITFYLYQSSAGSLYTEMAILIGVFMLGLALGTYYSYRLGKENLEFPAVLLLLTAAILFFVTYGRISPAVQLFYYILFLFTMALATGSLFVAATDRYYFGRADSNRGVGYAVEIIGSGIGALFAITVFLPLLGLQWLLISIIVLIVLTLAGAVVTVK